MKKRRNLLGITALMLVFALFMAGCTATQEGAPTAAPVENTAGISPNIEPQSEPQAEATPIPEEPSFANFTATDIAGNAVDESIFAEYDLTMINVWATYCGPCIQEMPHLGELSQEYADKGVQIVGILSDAYGRNGEITQSVVEKANGIIEDTGANYTHLLPNDQMVAFFLSQISVVPTTIFVDRNGNIVGETYFGSMDKAGWEQVIDSTLEAVGVVEGLGLPINEAGAENMDGHTEDADDYSGALLLPGG